MHSFAVVVTSYNYRAYVLEAVDSALAQRRAPSQVIVVDDGSTDGSGELLTSHYAGDPRVEVLACDNGGQLVAFQRGVARVEADIVCFMDSDDRWKPDYLGTLGAYYDARPDVGFVISDMAVFGAQERTLRYAKSELDLGHTAIATYALAPWYGAPTSALSMRLAYARGATDLPPDIADRWRLSADNCLVYGASLLGARKVYLPTGGVEYRIHQRNGWWSNRSATQQYLNRLHSRQLVAHYARAAGLDDSCLELAKLEYRTKPRADWRETRRYMSICLRSQATWTRRIALALGVLKTWLFEARTGRGARKAAS